MHQQVECDPHISNYPFDHYWTLTAEDPTLCPSDHQGPEWDENRFDSSQSNTLNAYQSTPYQNQARTQDLEPFTKHPPQALLDPDPDPDFALDFGESTWSYDVGQSLAGLEDFAAVDFDLNDDFNRNTQTSSSVTESTTCTNTPTDSSQESSLPISLALDAADQSEMPWETVSAPAMSKVTDTLAISSLPAASTTLVMTQSTDPGYVALQRDKVFACSVLSCGKCFGSQQSLL